MKDNKDLVLVIMLGLGVIVGYIAGQYDAKIDHKCLQYTEGKNAEN